MRILSSEIGFSEIALDPESNVSLTDNAGERRPRSTGSREHEPFVYQRPKDHIRSGSDSGGILNMLERLIAKWFQSFSLEQGCGKTWNNSLKKKETESFAYRSRESC